MNISELKNMFNDCELATDKIIIKSNLKEIIKFVKEKYGFDILKEIIAVDYQDKGVELIYRLYSTDDEEDALISIFVKDEVESIADIFDSAVADEREIYDMFGIRFVGNKELKRLYMPETWDGHPLKKDYDNKYTILIFY